MKIGGFGELENLRKAASREDSGTSKRAGAKESSSASTRSDEVELSGEARVMGKLSQVPDIREQKLEAIRSQVDKGEYVTRERLYNGIRKMLSDL